MQPVTKHIFSDCSSEISGIDISTEMEVDKWLPMVKEGQNGEVEELMSPWMKSIWKLYCDQRQLKP